jgi:hypothetical protein
LALDVFEERQLFRVVDVPVTKIVVIENGHFELPSMSWRRKAAQRAAGWPLNDLLEPPPRLLIITESAVTGISHA